MFGWRSFGLQVALELEEQYWWGAEIGRGLGIFKPKILSPPNSDFIRLPRDSKL